MNVTSMLFAEVSLFSVAMLCMLFFWFRRGQDNSMSSRWYTAVLTFFILSFTSNAAWGLLRGLSSSTADHIGLQFFLKIMFLVFLNLAVFAWVGYSETEMGNREFNDRDQLKVVFLPILFILVVVCTNGYTKVIFDIDVHGRYHMEDLFQAQMGMLVFYTGITGIRMLGKAMYESDPTKKSQMLQIGSFPMSFLLSWLFKTLLGDEFPVICVFVTLWLLFIFVGSTSEQVSTDKLTQIHNRQNLLTYINTKIRSHEDRLFLIMMDIDYFKRINDTYGHQEGDQALIRTTNALKSAAQSMNRRPYLARFGGDEFIVVAEAENIGEVQALCKEIQDQLDYFGSWSEKEYQMSLSIGIAEWQEGMKQKDLIEAADQALYMVKEEHHKKLDAAGA